MCKLRALPWAERVVLGHELDETIAALTGVAKADPNILTTEGFDAWLDLYTARVLKAAGPADRKAVAAMVRALDKPWTKLSQAKQAQLVEQAVAKLSLSAAQQAKVVKEIQLNLKGVILATKKAAEAQYGRGISTAFDAIDRRVVDYAGRSQTHFIRNAYGVRQEALSAQARKVVADGMRKGYDSAAIGAKLESTMTAAGLARSETYWRAVSSIFSARGRSYGLATSYEQAKIEMARITAVLDESTTEQCNFLHNKLIPVNGALAHYQGLDETADPEAVVNDQPFMRLGRGEDGGEILYLMKGGERLIVADVLQAARGVADNASAGQYRQRMSDADMLDAGIGFPPYHGFCRTITVAEL
jgi:hypothetical protein